MLDEAKKESVVTFKTVVDDDFKSVRINVGGYINGRKVCVVTAGSLLERESKSKATDDARNKALKDALEKCKVKQKAKIVNLDGVDHLWPSERGSVEPLKTPQQLALEKYGEHWYKNDGCIPDAGFRVEFNLVLSSGVTVTGCHAYTVPWSHSEYGSQHHVDFWRVSKEEVKPNTKELKMNYGKLTFAEIDDKVALVTRQRDEAALTMNAANNEVIKLLDAKLAKIKSELE